MRRSSIIGPLILIILGVLFLVRNVWRDIPLMDLLARYWPYLLIAWGVIRLIEIFWWVLESKPIPASGISGGEWLLVVFICLLGASVYAAQHSNWLPTVRGWRGVVLDLGESYQYPLASVEKPCPKNCRVTIESFQGNARISGASDTVVRASGRESVRSFRQTEADQASKQTPLELVQQGDEIIIRTNQDRATGHLRVISDLEITVPTDSSIEAHGRYGDVNIQNVNGSVNLEGRGQDVELSNVGGPVTVSGTSRDVHVSGVTQSLEVTLDRGDISVRAGSAVPKMDVRTRSGDIDLTLPPGSKFDLTAETDRGEVANDYGQPLKINAYRRRGTISGTVPGGPTLRLSTGRGDITVRKSNSDDAAFPETQKLPQSLNQPLKVERQ